MQGGISDVSDLGAPGGTPMLLWTSSFRLAYSVERGGMRFNGWPDGEPAEEQPQVLIEVFDVMRGEAMAVIQEAEAQS